MLTIDDGQDRSEFLAFQSEILLESGQPRLRSIVSVDIWDRDDSLSECCKCQLALHALTVQDVDDDQDAEPRVKFEFELLFHLETSLVGHVGVIRRPARVVGQSLIMLGLFDLDNVCFRRHDCGSRAETRRIRVETSRGDPLATEKTCSFL